MRSSEDSRYCRVSALTDGRIAYPSSLRTSTHIRLCADFTLLRHASLYSFFGGTGILTRFPSPTPFGLGLGPD